VDEERGKGRDIERQRGRREERKEKKRGEKREVNRGKEEVVVLIRGTTGQPLHCVDPVHQCDWV
jgi:hypothetical protein